MKRLFAKFVVNALLLMLIFSGSSFAGAATEWNLDKAHTSITFTINHFVTPVQGNFEDYDIDLNFDPENLEGSSINVSIQVASVKTGWGPRDEHLTYADWFDAENYPIMSFKSSEIMSKGNDNYVAKGKLKIKDVETEVELPFILLGVKKVSEDMKPMYDNIDEIASFAVHYSLDREEYNIGTGTSSPGKAAMFYRKFVGNEVKIFIAVEANCKTS
jgi:polyisoprenoid-binding protein YceI